MIKAIATLIAVLLFTTDFVFGAESELSVNVSAAAKKLADQSSYRWKTTTRMEGGGPFGGAPPTTTGQIERDGCQFVSSTSAQSMLEFARKNNKTAVVLDGDWMTLDQAMARSPVGRGGGPFGAGGVMPRIQVRAGQKLSCSDDCGTQLIEWGNVYLASR